MKWKKPEQSPPNTSLGTYTKEHKWLLLSVVAVFLVVLAAAAGLVMFFGGNGNGNETEDITEDTEHVETTEAEDVRPSVEERMEILGSLKSNPDGLSVEERRSVLNALNGNGEED